MRHRFPAKQVLSGVSQGIRYRSRMNFGRHVVPLERRRDEEVDRLVGLGGRVVDDRRRSDGTGWVVLADPEGNEFCIERSDAERAPLVEKLSRALAAVGDLITKVQPDQ